MLGVTNCVTLEIVPKAVGNSRKEVGLRSGINSGVVRDDTPSFLVQQDLIDNIITEPIDFIKVDIEGYEGVALEGAQRVLSEYQPILFLEIHPLQLKQYDSSVGSIFNRLSRLYNNVVIYEERDMSTFYEKVCFYYAGMSSMQEIKDIEAYVGRCEAGEIRKPFWAICRK